MPTSENTEGKKLKPGDLVRLKSGGPCMTVKAPAEDPDHYHCCWFTPNGEAHSALFPAKVLVRGHNTDNLSWFRMI